MADSDRTLDLTTLQEVERLLATTDFASADELVGRGLGALAESGARTGRVDQPAAALVDGGPPLPRRR